MNYRTTESYNDMIENCNNGNRKDAAKIGAEYGRYANDLLKQYSEGDLVDGLEDLVLLVEMICEARHLSDNQ